MFFHNFWSAGAIIIAIFQLSTRCSLAILIHLPMHAHENIESTNLAVMRPQGIKLFSKIDACCKNCKLRVKLALTWLSRSWNPWSWCELQRLLNTIHIIWTPWLKETWSLRTVIGIRLRITTVRVWRWWWSIRWI